MGRRLFVGNLPYSCTEEEVRGHFAERWQVSEVTIVTDRDTGRSRGFGFVELGSDEAAREAISQMDGSEMGGRRLAVREAHGRSPRAPGGRPGRRGAVNPPAVTRRAGPRGGNGARHEVPRGGLEAAGVGRWSPPPGPDGQGPPWDDAPPDFDDGGKSRRRERRKKKKARHEPDW